MQDVAARAKVSIATVSRALSAPDTVAAGTLARVRDAIDALDYRVDARARSLRKGNAQIVVVIVNDLDNPFITELIHGIEDTARALGLSVLLGDSQRDPEREREYANLVSTKRAQGIIQLSPRPLFAEPDESPNVPIVSVLDCVPEAPVPRVQIDNRAAAREAVEHLISLGHTRIATITGPESSTQSNDRTAGYVDAMRAAGLGVSDALQLAADYTAASGAAAAERLYAMQPRPTAVFCFNDAMALGAISALVERGVQVPRDVSVIGFDDISLARYFNPPLTTVRQPAIELGATALRLLARLMNGEAVEKRRRLLDHQLIVRGSTAPPAAGNSASPSGR